MGVAPSGVVVYTSIRKPGSTTDKEIVIDSGILQKLSVSYFSRLSMSSKCDLSQLDG